MNHYSRYYIIHIGINSKMLYHMFKNMFSWHKLDISHLNIINNMFYRHLMVFYSLQSLSMNQHINHLVF